MFNGTHDIYLVTAEPQFVTQAVKNIFPIAGAAYSEFEVVGGVFTGEANVLASGQDKSSAIENLLTGYTLEESFGFGDSVSDIDMLEKTSFPICIRRPKQESNLALRRYARSKGWNIVNPGSTDKKVRNILGLT